MISNVLYLTDCYTEFARILDCCLDPFSLYKHCLAAFSPRYCVFAFYTQHQGQDKAFFFSLFSLLTLESRSRRRKPLFSRRRRKVPSLLTHYIRTYIAAMSQTPFDWINKDCAVERALQQLLYSVHVAIQLCNACWAEQNPQLGHDMIWKEKNVV